MISASLGTPSTATASNCPWIRLHNLPVGARISIFTGMGMSDRRHVYLGCGVRQLRDTLPFVTHPPLILDCRARLSGRTELWLFVHSLLAKGATDFHCAPSFFSRLFFVPKPDGLHRPILYLKALNSYVLGGQTSDRDSSFDLHCIRLGRVGFSPRYDRHVS